MIKFKLTLLNIYRNIFKNISLIQIFDNRIYINSPVVQDPDGLYWCSTRVVLTQGPENRNHIGGKGYWGYCKPGCDTKPDANRKVSMEF